MRQSGILAAAGLHALEHHVERLAEDHENARQLANGLSEVCGVEVGQPDTNMVFMAFDDPQRIAGALAERGITVSAGSPMRLVTHLDVTGDDVDHVVRELEQVLA